VGAILDFTKQAGIDLIVMGTVNRVDRKGIMIGSTAEKVCYLAFCSIMALKPEGFVSPIEV